MGMNMKKFQAPTLQKALEMIREELGDGAIILQADPIKTGFLGRNAVEVTAAIDRKDLTPRFSLTVDESLEERPSPSVPETGARQFMKSFFSKKKEPAALSLPEPSTKKEALPSVKKLLEQTRVQTNATPAAETLQSSSSSMGQMYAIKSFIEPLQKELEGLRKTLVSQQPKKEDRTPSTAFLESEIQGLKKTLQAYIQDQKYEDENLPQVLRQLRDFWRAQGMTERQIFAFFDKFNSLESGSISTMIEPLLSKAISESRVPAEEKKAKIVVLVGPTGVGKTTTIAKLAAFEKLKKNRSVAMVTLDDYKIGGTDQLNHYARILEAPFIKIRPDLSLEEQIKAITADTIFIDTYGCSPRDEKRLMTLRQNLRFKDTELSNRLEVHLVLPVGLPAQDVEPLIEAFSRIHPNYLLFTKWDETEHWGGMLASILSSSLPVSFVGHGQEVPDDLAVFSSKSFIETVTKVQS